MTEPLLPLDYVRPSPPPRRREPRRGDCVFAFLVGGCYAVAMYGMEAMPKVRHWSYEWERANLVLTVNACAALLLFGLGLGHVLVEGSRRCPGLNIFMTAMAGSVPIVQSLTTLWLNCNWA